MSIQWETIEVLPKIDNADPYNKAQKASSRVIVWVTHNEVNIKPHASFGQYYHSIDHWNIDGHSGQGWAVTHWANINQP